MFGHAIHLFNRTGNLCLPEILGKMNYIVCFINGNKYILLIYTTPI